jgi:hypothetical protein
MIDPTQKMLDGKQGRNLGVANQHSISLDPPRHAPASAPVELTTRPSSPTTVQRHDSSTASSSQRVFSRSTTPGH